MRNYIYFCRNRYFKKMKAKGWIKRTLLGVMTCGIILASCVSRNQKEMKELSQKGVLKEGYIIKQDSLHPDIYIYQFNVGDTTYSGQFHTPTAKNGNKMKFKNGDLIEVVYLKNNPNVNRRFNW